MQQVKGKQGPSPSVRINAVIADPQRRCPEAREGTLEMWVFILRGVNDDRVWVTDGRNVGARL